MYKDEVLAYLKQLTDCKEDEKLNTLSLEGYGKRKTKRTER